MFRTRKSLAVLAIAGSLGVAGCGDDDNETSTTTTTESGATGATGASGSAGALPSDVITVGNEICTQGNNELNKAFGQAGGDSEKQFVNDVVVPNIQGQIDDLRGMDDSEELQSVLDDAETILGDIEADPDLFYSQDGEPFAKINDDLTELGLSACAE